MMIARLTAEAAREEFKLDDVGFHLNPDNPIIAITDMGTEISGTDMLRAALVLLWSKLSDPDWEITQMNVRELGIHLAMCDPDDVAQDEE